MSQSQATTLANIINGRISTGPLKGKFAPGFSGNPGGDAGRARRDLNRDTIAAMHAEFKKNGEKAIALVCKNNPAMFLKMLVLLVPRELQIEHSGGVKAMTDEQLERSLEILKEIAAARDAANAKLIEANAVPVSKPKKLRGPRKRVLIPGELRKRKTIASLPEEAEQS